MLCWFVGEKIFGEKHLISERVDWEGLICDGWRI